MKNSTKIWLDYSKGNYQSANILLESHLNNTCLQNVQQTIEKVLKALFMELSLKLKRTHNIHDLVDVLKENEIFIDISYDDCDFIDSVYLPSKYTFGSALPDFDPDYNVCKGSIEIS